jgi:hypothetical protein
MYKHPEIDYQPQHPQYYEPNHLHFMNSEKGKGKFKKLAKRASKAAKKVKSKVKKVKSKVKKVKSKVKKVVKKAAKSLEYSDSDCECKK